MNVAQDEEAVSAIAAAIGEPARARMLYGLADGRARTATELAVLAGVTPSTASVHLQRLQAQRLVKVITQGKHRYCSLAGPDVNAVLEALGVLAGGAPAAFVPRTPHRLRAARTCYDHLAGTLGVSLHDRFTALEYISGGSHAEDGYDITPRGAKAFASLGIDIEATRALRRRFAYPCLDWSERRPHLGGSLGAAVLNVLLKRRWVSRISTAAPCPSRPPEGARCSPASACGIDPPAFRASTTETQSHRESQRRLARLARNRRSPNRSPRPAARCIDQSDRTSAGRGDARGVGYRGSSDFSGIAGFREPSRPHSPFIPSPRAHQFLEVARMGARGEETGRPVACARKSSRGAKKLTVSSTEKSSMYLSVFVSLW